MVKLKGNKRNSKGWRLLKVAKNETNGITLIALIIAIVVLIILATITISTLTGENGILNKAQEAMNKTNTAQIEEEKDLLKMESEINNSIGSYDVWNGTNSTEPTIKNGKEIYIYTCAELKWLADKVNSGETFDNYTIYLMNNLDFGAKEENGSWATENNENVKWTPIGSSNNDNSYRLNAIFEGNSHIIKGVYVSNTNDFNGIFGNANTIKNLTIKDSYIEGADCTAGIVGALREGEISNCYVENTIIKGNDYTGGITGQFTGSSISNCGSSANIISGGCAGGIVGRVVSNVEIEKCYNIGNINSSARTGGILGDSSSSIKVNISQSYNTGNILGNMYTGGIAGLIYGNIKNSYNSGSISSSNNSGGTQAGGIVGDISGEGIGYNCYNIGKVIAPIEITYTSWSGGVAACLSGGATMYNCYNYGEITAKYYGGAIGRLYGDSNAYDCYFLSSIASKGVQNNVQGTIENITSKTSDEMNSNILLQWLNNEEEIWKADNNNINFGYPILSWQ